MSPSVLQSITVPDGPFQGKEVPVEVDDNWHMVLDFGDSRLATLAAQGCIQDTRARQVELRGLESTVALDILDVSAPVEVLRAGSGWEQVQLPQAGRAAGPGHHVGIEHLVDCIQNGIKPVLSVDHALHVIEIIEKSLVAVKTGQRQLLQSAIQHVLEDGKHEVIVRLA